MANQTLSFISLILRPCVKLLTSNDVWKTAFIAILFLTLANQVTAHSGGLNKQGCHAGSKPYHCHRGPKAAPKASSQSTILSGTVTHVRDGDTIEVNGTAVRLSALDCPENDTRQGQAATKLAKQFLGAQAICELTGAKTHDRVVGYCSIGGNDFGSYMMQNSSCEVWRKYDVWNRY